MIKAIIGFIWKFLIFGCSFISFNLFTHDLSLAYFTIGVMASLVVVINIALQMYHFYKPVFKLDKVNLTRPLTRRNE